MLQMLSEILGKVWIAHITKVQFEAYVETLTSTQRSKMQKLKVRVLKAAQEAGVNQDVQNTALVQSQQECARLKLEVSAQKIRIGRLEDKVSTLRRRLKRREVRGAGEDEGGESEEDSDGGGGGQDTDVESGGAGNDEPEGEDQEEVQAQMEEKLKYTLMMLAVRWHTEIVAEKGSILVGALIATLYFSDLVNSDAKGLALIGCIFYVGETLCDVIFVEVMDKIVSVPMLSVIKYEKLFSRESAVQFFTLAIVCTSIASCTAMAASIEL